jgi:hypothetical protein
VSAAVIDARSFEDRRPVVCPGCCGALIRSGRAIAGKPCQACYYEDPKRWTRRRRAAAAGLLLALLSWPLRAAEEDRAFHVVDLSAFSHMAPGAASIPTHIEVAGWVTYKKVEADGDVHLRLCDGEDCIVAECIPELPEIAAHFAILAYTTSWQDAGPLLDKLREEGWELVLEFRLGAWVVRGWNTNLEAAVHEFVSGRHETGPAAIALAFCLSREAKS